ncbi:helix-turn-helix domain-containing protein [Streptomyces sp. NPDC039016]|uniref:helix-turn-helix domain-containing protein n=1 Tax=Streptomyces sp. NPDC039016 TaxID=3154330 RepID=UPI00340EE52B
MGIGSADGSHGRLGVCLEISSTATLAALPPRLSPGDHLTPVFGDRSRTLGTSRNASQRLAPRDRAICAGQLRNCDCNDSDGQCTAKERVLQRSAISAHTVCRDGRIRGTDPMPGRRLTRADRQQIAAGLAQRLSYADIARRLNRPASTVSREVARNGGPARYRAELAQLATTHRARRRPPPRLRCSGPSSISALTPTQRPRSSPTSPQHLSKPASRAPPPA